MPILRSATDGPGSGHSTARSVACHIVERKADRRILPVRPEFQGQSFVGRHACRLPGLRSASGHSIGDEGAFARAYANMNGRVDSSGKRGQVLTCNFRLPMSRLPILRNKH